MTQRRHFVQILPFAGLAWLAACSDKAPSSAPTPAPVAAPPAPPPAPVAETTPAPMPASAAAPAPIATAPATPATPPATGPVSESEPVAVSLGYVADASRADGTKYKNHVAGQACSSCMLYTGKAGEASGPCAIFGGRSVSAKAWCSAYVRKTG